jgi:ribosomal protein S18 acetylase RimI-like enzyme
LPKQRQSVSAADKACHEMSAGRIDKGVWADAPWIDKLLKANQAAFGSLGGHELFWRLALPGNSNEHILVIRPVAFVHYRRNRTGLRVVYEIVVDERSKQRGLGRALMEAVGRPVTLRTDTGNDEANNFYKRIGLVVVGVARKRDGTKLNVYQGW